MGKASRAVKGSDRAAQLRARAERKRQAHANKVPDAPIWEYPDRVREASTSSASEHAALSSLMDVSVRIVDPNAAPGYMHPQSAAAALGISVEEFALAWTVLHERGLVEWDTDRRVHQYTQEATEEAVAAAIGSIGDGTDPRAQAARDQAARRGW